MSISNLCTALTLRFTVLFSILFLQLIVLTFVLEHFQYNKLKLVNIFNKHYLYWQIIYCLFVFFFC